MAYTPINWQTGDTITAEKMNKMDNGWSVATARQTICDENVTTVDDGGVYDGLLSYAQLIENEEIVVTVNNNEYTLQRMDLDNGDWVTYVYGGYDIQLGDVDFSEYPFCVISDPYEGNILCTESGGTYSVRIEAQTSTVQTSTEFQTAVRSCADTSAVPMFCVSGVTTATEMVSAFTSNRILYFFDGSAMKFITFTDGSIIEFTPQSSATQAVFIDGIFTVFRV